MDARPNHPTHGWAHMRVTVILVAAALIGVVGAFYALIGPGTPESVPPEPRAETVPMVSETERPPGTEPVSESGTQDEPEGAAIRAPVERPPIPLSRLLPLLEAAERLAHGEDAGAYRKALSRLTNVSSGILAHDDTRERLLRLFEDPTAHAGGTGDLWKSLLRAGREGELRPRVLRRLETLHAGAASPTAAPATARDVTAIVELLVELASPEERDSRVIEYIDHFAKEGSPPSAVLADLLATVSGERSEALVNRIVSLLDGSMRDFAFKALVRLTNDEARSAATNAFLQLTDRRTQRIWARDIGPLIDLAAAKLLRDHFVGSGGEEVYLMSLLRSPRPTVVAERTYLAGIVKQILLDPDVARCIVALEFATTRAKELRNSEILDVLEKLEEDPGTRADEHRAKLVRRAIEAVTEGLYGK